MTDYEIVLRLAVFAGLLVLLAIAERMAPRRPWSMPKTARWLSNLGLVGLNSVVLRLLPILPLVQFAQWIEERDWGLFAWTNVPDWLAFVLAILALDLTVYGQHVLFHHVPLLWRLHMVHHADLDIDVTTGVRFHTVEVVISLFLKMAVIAALGTSAAAVLVFEILLNATSMFNHANLRLPGAMDRVLRWFVVTPDMHRVHHSTKMYETNSNFGFNLPWWDRLFGTYRSQPERGHAGMSIGLEAIRDPQRTGYLHRMLALPFARRSDVQRAAVEEPVTR
jgi:sterol desaturase/sphingolipid hydroxylase (fatty acid hydroxylase superfamily)